MAASDCSRMRTHDERTSHDKLGRGAVDVDAVVSLHRVRAGVFRETLRQGQHKHVVMLRQTIDVTLGDDVIVKVPGDTRWGCGSGGGGDATAEACTLTLADGLIHRLLGHFHASLQTRRQQTFYYGLGMLV